MQVSSLQAGAVGTGRTTATGAVRAPVASAAVTPPTATHEAPRLREGLRGWLPGLNREVAQAQQSRDFLDEVSGHLQTLKAGLSASLASRAPVGERVDESLTALDRAWRARSGASGGALDAQLRYTAPDPATQRFSVRGLDFPSLQTGGREVLALSVGVPGQRPLPVVMEPGLSERDIVLRLSQALAPVGVQAMRGEQGDLMLATPESQWPAVRDSLAIKGGGQRFPTGQFHRVRTEPEAEAVPVATWATASVEERKTTLRGVLTALDRVRDAKVVVSKALADSVTSLEANRPPEGADWAVAAAGAFESAALDGGFAVRAALVSAADGLHRDRVQAVMRER